MKKNFYFGLAGLALFEILKVFFIMPMPGSQEMDSIDVAYFLNTYRWYFRIVFILMIIAGSRSAFQVKHKWIPAVALIPVLYVVYFFNFKMMADKMFLQPETLTFKGRTDNTLSDSTVVLAFAHQGEAKAYPLRYIVYHHQVRDTVGGKPVMITYCSVCRTGRVFEPLVKGQPENFRLVGMDHFNAMFEDNNTKSWWRQSTGEAVAGPLKGESLPELESMQLTANKFFSLYPFGSVMQAEEASKENYDSLGKFERGKSKGQLTRTDSLSWKDKSWVVGVVNEDGQSKAYDWIQLKEKRIINDAIGSTPVVIALSDDQQSFAVFERPAENDNFTIRNDTIFAGEKSFDFSGRDLSTSSGQLKRVKAYQEFWHSWRTFHPGTEKYSGQNHSDQ
jgi:hypothetical protein